MIKNVADIQKEHRICKRCNALNDVTIYNLLLPISNDLHNIFSAFRLLISPSC